jgi:hypothetical protein
MDYYMYPIQLSFFSVLNLILYFCRWNVPLNSWQLLSVLSLLPDGHVAWPPVCAKSKLFWQQSHRRGPPPPSCGSLPLPHPWRKSPPPPGICATSRTSKIYWYKRKRRKKLKILNDYHRIPINTYKFIVLLNLNTSGIISIRIFFAYNNGSTRFLATGFLMNRRHIDPEVRPNIFQIQFRIRRDI